jgi:hypothetical protein
VASRSLEKTTEGATLVDAERQHILGVLIFLWVITTMGRTRWKWPFGS